MHRSALLTLTTGVTSYEATFPTLTPARVSFFREATRNDLLEAWLEASVTGKTLSR